MPGERLFDLDRFLAAQDGGVFEQALRELREGRKQTHWMWFIFPQNRGLGRSPISIYYGLEGVDEAAHYHAHPILGSRLAECCQAILPHLREGSAEDVLGPVDARKLESSMQLFSDACPDQPLFEEVLDAIDRADQPGDQLPT